MFLGTLTNYPRHISSTFFRSPHTVSLLSFKCISWECIHVASISSYSFLLSMSLIKLSPLLVYWNFLVLMTRDPRCVFALAGFPHVALFLFLDSFMLYLEKQACPKALSWHLLLAQQLGIWAVNHTALEDSIQGLPLWAAPPCPIYLPFSTLSNGNNDTTYILGFFKKKF